MKLEERIAKAVSDFLESDVIEEKINQEMGKAVDAAFSELFSGYRAPVKDAIEEKLKEQLVPVIEKRDFSGYIVKLDAVLTEVLKNTTVENKTIIEKFESFATFKKPEKVYLSEIFDQYLKHVSEEIDTSKLEIDYDDEPTYESPECLMEYELDDDRWGFTSSFEYATVKLSCKEDASMNFKLKLSRWRDDDWAIIGNNFKNIENLRTLSDFEIFLMNLSTHKVSIEIDEEALEDYAEIEERPEPTY